MIQTPPEATTANVAGVSARVRGLLAERNTPHADMAKALGMSRTAFGRRIRSEVSFSAESIRTLASELRVPVDYFYTDPTH